MVPFSLQSTNNFNIYDILFGAIFVSVFCGIFIFLGAAPQSCEVEGKITVSKPSPAANKACPSGVQETSNPEVPVSQAPTVSKESIPPLSGTEALKLGILAISHSLDLHYITASCRSFSTCLFVSNFLLATEAFQIFDLKATRKDFT